MYGVKKRTKANFCLKHSTSGLSGQIIQKLGAIILKIGGSDKQVAMRDLCVHTFAFDVSDFLSFSLILDDKIGEN